MKKQIYIHYGHDRFVPDQFRVPENRVYFTKPKGGLWASPIDAKYGWKDWCESEEFRECSDQNSFQFTLSDDSIVFNIHNVLDLNALPQQKHEKHLAYDIDFEAMIQSGFDAIELHLSEDPELYWELYGWDCDSILILNKDVIMPITENQEG